MKKFLYFRTTSSIGGDDAESDSFTVDVKDITGMEAVDATTLHLWFKSQNNIHSPAAGNNAVVNDYVIFTITTQTHKKVMKAIIEAMNSSDPITTIADDVTDEYIVPEITNISAAVYDPLTEDITT